MNTYDADIFNDHRCCTNIWVVTFSHNGNYGGQATIACKKERRARELFSQLYSSNCKIMSVQLRQDIRRGLESYKLTYLYGEGYKNRGERVIRAESITEAIQVFWMKRNDKYTKLIGCNMIEGEWISLEDYEASRKKK